MADYPGLNDDKMQINILIQVVRRLNVLKVPLAVSIFCITRRLYILTPRCKVGVKPVEK